MKASILSRALFAVLVCLAALVPPIVSAQAPHKAPRPKMRPMGSLPSGNHYELQINGVTVAQFQEVSGLKSESEIAEYRNGGSGNLSPRKITGNSKVGDITLKRGVIAGDSQLNSWLNEVRSGRKHKRREIRIVLLNETGQTVQVWKLKNSAPKRWKGPKLGGKGNDTAMEELVLSTENVEIVPPK